MLLLSPLVLARRYGFAKPTFINNLALVSTVGIYQYLFLGSLCILISINLNSQLCHLPGDVLYELFGHHYYIVKNIPTFVLSLMTRICYYKVLNGGKLLWSA